MSSDTVKSRPDLASVSERPLSQSLEYGQDFQPFRIGDSSDGLTASAPASTSGSNPSSSEEAALASLDDVTQLLRMETISDTEARRVIAFFKIASVISVALIVVLGVLKSNHHGTELLVLNRNYHAAVLATSCLLLLILSSLAYCWLDRLRLSWRAGMVWSARRKHAVRAVGTRLLVLLAILVSCVITNASVLAQPSLLCFSRWLGALNFIRWSGYNTFLMLLCIDGHCIVLTPDSERKDAMVKDKPWTYHWPKYIYWAIVEGFLAWNFALAVEDGHQVRIRSVDGGLVQCEWGERLECALLPANIISTALVAAAFCGWSLAYAAYLYTCWSQLKVRVYQQYRVLHMYLQIQLRFNAVVFVIFVIVTIVLWFAGGVACIQYVLGYFGNIPKMLILTALQCASLYLNLPRLSSDGPPKPLALLQQFSWTESYKAKKLRRRADRLAATHPHLVHEPMFCFETAIKSFYWSAMIYDYTEAEGHRFQNLPESIRELLGEMETAMRLFGLVKRHLFYDRVLETKVLVAWNERLIIVCVRGSAEVANFVADAQLVQVAHPPRRRYRGRTPRVHAGFLRTWEANGVKKRVLDHVAALVDSATDRSAVRVLFTGHSLGGAVASLAAIDFVNRCNLAPSQVAVYTFGCPRVGNHAFAEEYMEVVPDTWHVINDQDIVTHRMKFFGWYKRAGHRVIINDKGACVVRPSLMELSMLQTLLHGCVKHHHNAQYQRALLTVITNQLRESSRHSDGLLGLLELLKAVPLVRDALRTHAEHVGLDLSDAVRAVSTQSSAALSKSQRLSLLRHAGVLESLDVDDDDDDGVEQEHVAVGFIEDAADNLGDAPDMRTTNPSPVTVEKTSDHSGVEQAETQAGENKSSRRLNWWPRTRLHAHDSTPTSDAESEGAKADGDKEVVIDLSRAAGEAGRCDKECFDIPEDEAAEDSVAEKQEAGSAHNGPRPSRARRTRGRLGGWSCPLDCSAEELPSNAQLHGSVVGIGAAPDMAACRHTAPRWAKGLARQVASRGHTHARDNRD